MKAIAIGVSEANPPAWRSIASLLFTLHVSFPQIHEFYLKELLPNTHFYKALYPKFSGIIGITTFTCPAFLFDIVHDNGTVNTDYAT